MKVYRGYNKEVGPISYPNWIYVTADPEQAKYYATKDGFVKDGAIIEYDMDKDNMSWISLSKINSMAENDNEYYSEEDLLWYQEELAYSLRGLRDSIVFVDPYNKDHTIYIVLDKSLLQNGRVLSQEEFDAIQLKESAYDNEINKALANAGILNEKVITVNAELADTQLVTSPYELNEIIENHPEKRIIYDMEHNWFLVGNSETSIHIHLVNDALQDGIYAPFEYNGELIDGSQEDDGDTYCDLHRDELVLFVTSANTEKNVHYLEDNYYYTYVYKNYVVYDRKYDFRFTPLYKILGKPLSVTYWDGFNKKDMLKESILDAKSVGDELMNVILKNPTRKELSDNNMNTCRGAMGKSGNFYFISLSELAHCDLFDTLEQMGIYDAPYNTFKYSNKTNTFYYYDPDNDLDFDLIKKELSKSPYFKNFAGCHFDTFTDPDYDPDLYESVQLTEREDLTNFNRIAGFYHLKTKKFELFPRTSEDISPEDDEINDYIHNVHSMDEFVEFDIVRFGIEDIPGEGVVCYIEGDTKRHVEECYYAILEKYAEECEIIKYELEYYVGNEHKYIFLDRYGNQIMESLNEVVTPEQVPEKLYHATFSKLLRKIKKCGYLGKSPYKLWSDSNNKYVYLASDPDEAYSYAETALDDCENERLYDMLEDDDIIILEIDTKYLDKNKLFRDENVVDGETTYQYEGIINCQLMKIYNP